MNSERARVEEPSEVRAKPCVTMWGWGLSGPVCSERTSACTADKRYVTTATYLKSSCKAVGQKPRIYAHGTADCARFILYYTAAEFRLLITLTSELTLGKAA